MERGTHPAAVFRPDDFGPLVARVEGGPETWREEWLEDHVAALEECGDSDDGEDDAE